MKLAFITPQVGGGGAERVLSIISKGLVERGHQVSIYVTSYNRCDQAYSFSDKLNLVFLNDISKSRIKKAICLRKLLKKERPDYAISFFPITSLYYFIAGFGLGIKLIVSERSSPKDYPTSKFLRLIRLMSFKKAKFVVFQTKAAASYFSHRVKKERVVIVPNPISFDNLPKPTFENDVVIAAGRLFPEKNFEVLIRGFSIFKKKHPNFLLKIFGAGPQSEQLKSLCKSLDLKESIFPYSESLWEEEAKSKIFCMSSLFEGLPNALMEAEAIGLPVVTTDFRPLGAASEIVSAGCNGEIVPSGDSESLANALSKVADNYPQYKTNSLAFAQQMRLIFNSDIVVDAWDSLFD